MKTIVFLLFAISILGCAPTPSSGGSQVISPTTELPPTEVLTSAPTRTVLQSLPAIPAVPSTPSAAGKMLFERAFKAGEDADYETAIAVYTQIIAQEPGYVDAYNYRAGVYLELGDLAQALADYDRAIALDPNNAYLYSNRAAVFLNQENYGQAMGDYDKALSLRADAVDILTYRGWARFKNGQVEEALSDYNSALKIDPKSAMVYSRRAWFYMKRGNTQQALADYDQALELDPDNAARLSVRGWANLRAGKTAESVADLRRALRLDPENATVLNNLCWSLSLGLPWTEMNALDLCERALKRDPRNGNYRDSRGLARALRNDLEGALDDFRYFVTWSKTHGMYSEYGRKREVWIHELEAGRNPFDSVTLRDLLEE